MLPPKPRRSTITKVYPRSMSRAPSMKSWKRADGPTRSHPPGDVSPACEKYGPTDRITGVFACGGRCAGRSTSACSSTSLPSEDGKYASVHAAPLGTRGFSSWVIGASAAADAGAACATEGRPVVRLVMMASAPAAATGETTLLRMFIHSPPNSRRDRLVSHRG